MINAKLRNFDKV